MASISDCTHFNSVDVVAGTTQQTFSVTDAQRKENSEVGCGFLITAQGEGRFSPQITLYDRDNTTEVHNENFSIEPNSPELTLNRVGLQNIQGVQSLVIEVNTNDDVDIQIAFGLQGHAP